MKKLRHALLIGFIAISLGNSTTVAKSEPFALSVILGALEQKENVHVDQWSIMAREAVHSIDSDKSFMEKWETTKKNVPGFAWKVERDSSRVIATGTRQQDRAEETIVLASNLSYETESYITYEIKGTDYSSFTEELAKKRTDALFQGAATFFTCVKGNFSDIMDKVLPSEMNHWLKDFEAVEIESLKEDGFLSVTAQSSLFEQSYLTEHYNLQLAMRYDGMGSSTSFVIGTPIITFEY